MTIVRDLTTTRRRERRFWVSSAAILMAGVATVWCIYAWSLHRRGDPDPAHRRINALRPVLTAIPGDAHVENRDVLGPRWDSCDGKQHGWNPATVDIEFTSLLAPHVVLEHVAASLHSMGWTYEASDSQTGSWYWHKKIQGSTAHVEFLGGPDANPPDWALQAAANAATHPLSC